MLEELLKTTYIITITRQSLPGSIDPLFNCDEEIIKKDNLMKRIDWLKDNMSDGSIFSEEEVFDHHEDLMMDENYDNVDYEYVRPTMEEILNLIDKGDIFAIESFINGDVNRIADYTVCSLFDWLC